MSTVRIIGVVLWGAVAVAVFGALVASAPEPPASSPIARIWTPNSAPAVAQTVDGEAGPVIHWGGRR